MPTINELSQVQTLSDADSVATWSAINASTRRFTLATLKAYFAAGNFTNPLYLDWDTLEGVEGPADGAVAQVSTSDAGSHTDPVVGGTVSNSGLYQWSADPAGWQWVSATDAFLAQEALAEIEPAKDAALLEISTAKDAAVLEVETEGAAQVALATTQAGIATTQAGIATAAVGAVLQAPEITLQPDDGVADGAWYAEFFVSTPTAYTLVRHTLFLDDGTGSAELSINKNDENYAGPFMVTSTSDSDAVSFSAAINDRISFQLENVTGTPGGCSIKLEGLPA